MSPKGSFLLLIFSIFFICATADLSDAPGGKRILAILDNAKIRSTHSTFFRFLEGKGYQVNLTTADQKVTLRTYGEWKFDHVIILGSGQELAQNEPEELISFIDAGKNVFIASDSNIDDRVREIATGCNVEFDEASTSVIDHLNYDSNDDGSHTLIASDNVAKIPIIFGKGIEAPILFQGVGQDIEEESSLLISLLWGYSTTYSGPLDGPLDTPHVLGQKTSLVTALQARNNARVIFSGSLQLFSDQFFGASVQKQGKKWEKSGNEEFAKAVLRWFLQEKGILRVTSVNHHRVGETTAPELYTVKENITYSIEIEEWNGSKWAPFHADDVQLEFSMIDPHVRTFLKSDGKGTFSSTFQITDVYGVFTFRVEYVRKGYSFLSSVTRVPVRPFRHNQYERFIDAAYPYYASSFSMMVGLFIFSLFFLYHKDKN